MNKVAIVFPTGRKTSRKVIDMLTDNLQETKRQDIDLELIVSYDPTFYGLPKEEFTVSEKARRFFDKITYTGPEETNTIIEEVSEFIDQGTAKILFEPRGYCTQKNRALFHGLKRKADHILFLDDDEYFVAPFKRQDGSLEWERQEVFGKHMSLQQEADITNGAHTGYFSPVPSEIDINLEEGLRERLGRILAIGSEVITERTFINTRDAVTYGNRDFMNAGPYEVEARDGVKFLTGGNIALNVESIREGKIPPYFNPVGARGEDAILGMQLQEAKVLKVPAYTFHDPFQKYVSITEEEYPESLDAIKVIPGTVDRFEKACLGWVKYAPFLIRMTADSENTYQSRIQAMKEELTDIGLEIDRQLGWDGFNKLGPTLEKYDMRSKKDVAELYRAREGWNLISKSL